MAAPRARVLFTISPWVTLFVALWLSSPSVDAVPTGDTLLLGSPDPAARNPGRMAVDPTELAPIRWETLPFNGVRSRDHGVTTKESGEPKGWHLPDAWHHWQVTLETAGQPPTPCPTRGPQLQHRCSPHVTLGPTVLEVGSETLGVAGVSSLPPRQTLTLQSPAPPGALEGALHVLGEGQVVLSLTRDDHRVPTRVDCFGRCEFTLPRGVGDVTVRWSSAPSPSALLLGRPETAP